MADQIIALCEFLGISGTPQNFAELVPWLLTVVVALAVTLGVLNLMKFLSTLGRRL